VSESTEKDVILESFKESAARKIEKMGRPFRPLLRCLDWGKFLQGDNSGGDLRLG